MAVTIVDNRVIWSEADVADWSGTAGTLYTTAPDPIELTGCLGFPASQENIEAYYVSTAVNLEDSLIYQWSQVLGAVDSIEIGGFAILLGDGTNRVAFHLAGEDVAGFRYSEGLPNWQCLVLDSSMIYLFDNVSYFYTEWAGTLASLDLSAITDIGVGFSVSSKAIGGAINTFADINRHGKEGISVIGGLTGDRGNFYQVYSDDNSRTSGKAYGVIRKLASGVYGLQGAFTCGSTGIGSSWFEDASGTSIIFEDRLIADDKYYLNVLGSTTFDTHFILDGFSMSSAGPLVLSDFSSNNITELSITNTSFRALGKTLTFANDGSAAIHIVTGNTFTGIGLIDPGKTIFNNNSFISTIEPSTSGALLIDNDGVDNISDLSFTALSQSDASNHAIYITDISTYTFTNFTYSGYAAVDGSTGGECVYNNSGGHVTINLSGGDFPTIQNAIDASTDVVNTITLSLTVKDESGNVIEGALAYIDDPSNTAPFIMNKLTNASGVASTSWGGGAVSGAYWRVRLYGYKPFVGISDIGTIDKDIPVTMIVDPQQS